MPPMPFLRQAFEHEPAANFINKEAWLRTSTRDSLGSGRSALDSQIGRHSDHGNSLRHFFFHIHDDKPSDDHNIHDIEFNAVSPRCAVLHTTFGTVLTHIPLPPWVGTYRRKDDCLVSCGNALSFTTKLEVERMDGICDGFPSQKMPSNRCLIGPNSRSIA